MGDANNLGDLQVNITGDFSELQTAIDQSVTVAQDGSQQIASAFQSIGDASGLVGRDLENFKQFLEEDARSGITLQQSLEDLAGSAKTMGDEIAGGAAAALDSLQASAQAAQASLGQVSASMDQTAASAKTDEEEVGGLRDVFEQLAALGEALAVTAGLIDLGKEALVASGNLATTTAAMGLMIGSAEEAKTALDGLRELALTSPFAFPDLTAAAQKLTAFGVDVEQLGPMIGAIADAAAATGKSFDTITQAMSRVALTGVVTQRQLVNLGVSWAELGDTMGVTADKAKAALTKGVLDADTALQVLHDTVESTFGGAAQTISQTITSQFAILKQQVEFTLEDLGTALTPFAMQIVQALGQIPPIIDGVITSFQNLDPEVQQFLEIVGGIAIAIGPVVVALTGFSLAIMAIGYVAPVLIPIAEAFAAIGIAVAAIHLSGLDQEITDFVGLVYRNTAGTDSIFKEVFTDIQTLAAEVPSASGVIDFFTSSLTKGNAIIATTAASTNQLDQELGKLEQISMGGFWSSFVNAIPGVQAARIAIVELTATLEQYGVFVEHLNTGKAIEVIAAQVHTAMASMATDATASAAAQDLAYKQAAISAEIAAKSVDKDAIAIAALNVKFQDTADATLLLFNGIATGTSSATKVVSELTAEVTKGSEEWGKLDAASRAMLTGMLVPALQQANAAVKDLAEGGALDAVSTKILAIGDAADKVTAKLPADFQDMMAGVAKGVNFQPMEAALNTAIANMKTQLATLPPALNDAMQSGMQNDIAIWTAASARLQDMLNVLKLVGQDKSMETLATQATSLANAENQGQLTSQQWQAGLNSIGTDLQKQVIPAMAQGVEITPQLVAALALISPALADAAQQGLGPFSAAVTHMVETSRGGALTVAAAFKDLGVTSLQAAADSVTKSGDDIIAILKGVGDASQLSAGQMVADEQALIKWAQDVIVPMQNLGLTISDNVLVQIAKISPAMAQAARDGPGALQAAIDAMTGKVTADTTTMASAFKALGIQTASSMQESIKDGEAYLKILQDQEAPMQAQLTAQISLYNNQLKFAQAAGASADSTLLLTEHLTAAKIEQQGLTDATMGLSKLYTGVVTAMGTAWTSFEKGMGDAIVSGQNFGQAFTNVLDQLKKSLAELIVTYFGNELKKAILDNTDALGGFTKVFNEVFSTAGSTMATAGKVAQQTAQTVVGAADEIGGAAQSAGQAMTNAAKTMTTATTNIGSSVTSLMSSFNMITQAIGAIASVIGAIEQARTNNLLGEIEISTRGSLNQLISMQGTLNDVDAGLKVIQSFDNGFWPGAMAEALTDLGTIASELAAGASGGGGGTGTGGGGDGGLGPAMAILTADMQTLDAVVTASTTAFTADTTAITSHSSAVTASSTATATNTAATTANTTSVTTAMTTAILSLGNLTTATTALTTDIGALGTAATAFTGALSGLTTATSTLVADVGTLDKSVTQFNADMGTLDSAVTQLTSSMTSVSSSVATFATDIGNLNAETSALVAAINALDSAAIALATAFGSAGAVLATLTSDFGKLDTATNAFAAELSKDTATLSSTFANLISQLNLAANSGFNFSASISSSTDAVTNAASLFSSAISSSANALQKLVGNAAVVTPAALTSDLGPLSAALALATASMVDFTNTSRQGIMTFGMAVQSAKDLATQFAAMNTASTGFAADIVALDTATTTYTTDLGKLDKSTTTYQIDLDKLDKSTTTYTKDFDKLDASTVTYQKDLDKLDTLVTTYQKDLDKLDTLVTTYQKDLDKLDTSTKTYTTDLGKLDTLVTTYQKDLDKLDKSTTTYQADLDKLDTSTTVYTKDLGTLDTSTATFAKDIGTLDTATGTLAKDFAALATAVQHLASEIASIHAPAPTTPGTPTTPTTPTATVPTNTAPTTPNPFLLSPFPSMLPLSSPSFPNNMNSNLSPGGSGGVQLTVNVTGNSVTSQALVDQLANKVGSAIVTNLRTMAGMKLG